MDNRLRVEKGLVIAIVGGGFGGAYAIRRLNKLKRRLALRKCYAHFSVILTKKKVLLDKKKS